MDQEGALPLANLADLLVGNTPALRVLHQCLMLAQARKLQATPAPAAGTEVRPAGPNDRRLVGELIAAVHRGLPELGTNRPVDDPEIWGEGRQ